MQFTGYDIQHNEDSIFVEVRSANMSPRYHGHTVALYYGGSGGVDITSVDPIADREQTNHSAEIIEAARRRLQDAFTEVMGAPDGHQITAPKAEVEAALDIQRCLQINGRFL